MLLQAIRAETLAELCFRVVANVLLEWDPCLRVIPNLFAKRANGQQTRQHLDFVLQRPVLPARPADPIDKE
jgi:hypothetical protein